ncbi:MAG: serine/threonine-protein phosphatase [Prevotella sp.]|nr:serine/threonine-protein phosphatase [Prevotella sp.]
MKIKIAQPQAIHQIGRRPNQEDSIYPVLNTASVKDFLFILCDGMGGHECGEVASGTVIQTMSSYIKSRFTPGEALPDSLLEEAIDAAYKALDEKDNQEGKKMGTTLTFLCFHRGGCTVAHIGDSRIYHVRPGKREILYRSRDHSLIYDLFEVGELTKDELKTAKNKNVITRVIMANQERPSKADIVHITDIEDGDYFYLCSDGMLEQMEDKQLLDIFGYGIPDEKKRDMLIAETVDSNDNHSAYIIRIDSVEHEEQDLLCPNNEPEARAANKILMAEEALNNSGDDTTGDSVMIVSRKQDSPSEPAPVDIPEQAPAAEEEDEEEEEEKTASPITPAEPESTDYDEPTSEPRRSERHKIKSSGTGKIMILALVTLAAIIAVAVYLFLGGNKNDDNNNAQPPVTEQPVKDEPKIRPPKRPAVTNNAKANKSKSTPEETTEPVKQHAPAQQSAKEQDKEKVSSPTPTTNATAPKGEGGQGSATE